MYKKLLVVALSMSSLVVLAESVSPAEIIKLTEAGTILSFDKLDQIALNQHAGATIKETELEKKYERYVYQVDLLVDTQKWEIDLDAVTGEVLKNKQD